MLARTNWIPLRAANLRFCERAHIQNAGVGGGGRTDANGKRVGIITARRDLLVTGFSFGVMKEPPTAAENTQRCSFLDCSGLASLKLFMEYMLSLEQLYENRGII
jgi:hypothetical protein